MNLRQRSVSLLELEETLAAFERVSLDDVQGVARKVFRSEAFQLAALGPVPAKTRLELAL